MRTARSATVSHPLETQRLEGAVRSKPFHLEERTRKCGLYDAIAKGTVLLLSTVTSGREKHTVINASTVARRSFRFVWEKNVLATTTCPCSARNMSLKEEKIASNSLRSVLKKKRNATCNWRIEWRFLRCEISFSRFYINLGVI